MQSLVTWKFASGQVNESWYQYDVDLGYEYIDNIDYTATLSPNTDYQVSSNGFSGIVMNEICLSWVDEP
jgi:hypothetical protein